MLICICRILHSIWLLHWPWDDHDDVIKWKHFPGYWPFVRGIHRSPVNSPHKGQWRRAWMFSLICAWINGRVNHREPGDLRRHRAHYDVIIMHDNPSSSDIAQCGYNRTVAYHNRTWSVCIFIYELMHIICVNMNLGEEMKTIKTFVVRWLFRIASDHKPLICTVSIMILQYYLQQIHCLCMKASGLMWFVSIAYCDFVCG